MAPGNYVACLVVSGGDAGRMFLYPARIVVADRHITDLTFDVTQQTISVLGQQVPAQ
jgi:hypothetical protein